MNRSVWALVIALIFLITPGAALAQVTLIDDDFANANLATNPGEGNGFTSLGQNPSSESGSSAFLTATNFGTRTAVIQSNDSFDPFRSDIQTTVIWDIPAAAITQSGFGRTWVGLRSSSLTGDHFLPAQEGFFIAIDQGTGDFLANAHRGLLVASLGGFQTTLAEFSWDSYNGTNGALEVTLTTTATTYAVQFSQATTVQSGALSGALSNAPSGGAFVVGGHHQTAADNSMEWSRVRVQQSPSVSFSVASQSVTEAAGTASITATLSATHTLPVSVPFTVNGSSTATQGADYTLSASPITIPAGQLSASATVTIIADGTDEDDQTVIVDMGNPTNALASGITTHTLTIQDSDAPPTVSFEADKSVSEAVGTASVRVNLSAASEKVVTVNVTVNGGSTAQGGGVDISSQATTVQIPVGQTFGDLDVTIVNDTDDEIDETEILDLGTLVNATPGAKTQHILTIQDNDAVVTLMESGSPLTEAGGQSTVTASIAASQSLPITVNLAFTGTADGSDYSTSATSITIPAGQTSGSMTITSTGDTDDELDETVVVDIASVVDGQEGSPNQVTATIEDDDAVVTLAVSGTPSMEKGLGVITFTASIATAQTRDVTIDLLFSGTATGGGTDYTESGTQIVIQSPATSGSVTATLVDDILDESNETIIVDIDQVLNGQESGTQQATGTITDDDADLSLTKTVSTVLDPDPAGGTLSYTLTVTNNSPYTTATGVTVSDPSLDISNPVSPYASITQGTITAGTSYSGSTWTVGTLAPGASASVELAVVLNVEHSITNSAEIATSDQDDPDSTPGNGSEDDFATVTVRQYDYGDLPAGYATTARHELLSGALRLGFLVDSDSGNQTSGTAVGDDSDADGDDDDSVVLPSQFAIGSAAPLTVSVSAAGWLYAWVDYDNDGTFAVGEQEFAGAVTGPSQVVTLTPPAGSNGFRQFRMRLCSVQTECDDPDEAASDGEVEDYQIEIIGVDYGDANSATHKTKFAQDGARHEVGGTVTHRLGALIDGDLGAQDNADASGDDTNMSDDEDGVVFATSIMTAGVVTTASVVVQTYGAGNLYGWIDYDGDGTFGTTAAEQIVNAPGIGLSGALVSHVFSFNVPTGLAAGNRFARFRFCSAATTCSTEIGLASDGEVEDYQVAILDAANTPNVAIDIPDVGGLTSPYTLTLIGSELRLQDASGSPVTLFYAPAAGINTLTIDGTAADDNLTVDFSGGNPIPPGGLVFNGLTESGGATGDEMTVLGGVFDTIVHTFENDHDGDILYTGATAPAGAQITYTGLEPVTQIVTVTDHYFVFTGGAETITLSDDGLAGDGQSLIESTLGESVNFTNPTGLLKVQAGTGDDVFNFPSLDNLITPSSIQIEGNDGEDRFSITANTTYGMFVDGGTPSTCNGDILDLDLTGVTGAYQTILGPGQGNWKFDAPGKTINFANMEVRVDALTDIEVDVAWDESTGYPADEREVTFTLTNNGIDEATCLRSAITIPTVLNLFGTPVEVYPTSSSGSYAAGEWLVNRILAGDSATLTFRGVIDTLMPETISTSIDATAATAVLSNDPDRTSNPTTNLASSNFTVQNVYRFPRKGTAISAQYVQLPSGLVRLVAGLFQGSPGLNTALLCRIPEPDGVLFNQPAASNFWKPCGEGLPIPLHVTDLFLDDRTLVGDVSDDRLWLASWGSAGLYYSDDYGESFTAAGPDLGGGAQPWANVYGITKDAGGILYISANNGLVFRSLNSGGTWQQVASLPGASSDTPWSMEAHPSVAGTIYAGTFGHGVFVTTDYGFTWAPLGGESRNNELLDTDHSGDDFAGHVFDMAFSPDGSGYLFIGTGRGVWRVPVDGAGQPTGPWEQMSITVALDSGSVVPEVRVLAFQEDTANEADLLVGTWGFGVQMSDEPLMNTAFFPTALREGQISMLTVAPDGTVLAGSDAFGIEPIATEATSTAAEPLSEAELPEGYALAQNYPNPFNPVTTIGFALPESGRVSLRIFDTLGREVAVLVDGLMQAGHHEVQFSASDLPTGTYLYRLETAAGAIARTLVLMK